MQGVFDRDQFSGGCFTAIGVADGVDAVTGAGLARQHAGTAGGAVGGWGVGLGEDHAAGGKSIQIWGLVFRSAHEIGVSDAVIVGIDIDDVGLAGRSRSEGKGNQACDSKSGHFLDFGVRFSAASKKLGCTDFVRESFMIFVSSETTSGFLLATFVVSLMSSSRL